MNKKLKMISASFGVFLILSACSGPETRVLPRQNVSPEEPYELTGAESVLEEANPFFLQEVLDFLSRTPRECGSDAEINAAEYLKRLLMEYEYEVVLQRFPVIYEDEERFGTNVIAVKSSEPANGDILLITASHDTAAGSPGANDNASGVVALLETARLISKMPTDTEIRFISFSETTKQRLGIRYYLESLTEEERSRMIGAVYLDSLGYIYDDTVSLGSVDGRPTMLGDILNETAAAELGFRWNYRADDSSSYMVFDTWRVPAVRLAQTMTAFEQGTPQDRSDIIDVEQLSEVSRVLSQTLAEVMSEETGSYLTASQAGEYRRDGALLQRIDRSVPFGQSVKMVEDYYGRSATLLEELENGDQIYQYPMKWLGVDQIILTDCRYVDGRLSEIVLEAEAAGIEPGEMKERLGDLYGAAAETADEEGRPSLIWKDLLGNLLFTMTETDESFTVRIRREEPELLELARYSPDQPAEYELPSVQQKAAAELAAQVLTPAMQEQIEAVVLFTDGIGGQTVYWYDRNARPEDEEPEHEAAGEDEGAVSADAEENSGPSLTLYLDVADIADPDGNYLDFNDSCRKLVRACAYFYIDEFGTKFQEQFTDSADEDFYQAFQYFVLSNQPDGDISDNPQTVRLTEHAEADARTLFFYRDEEMAQTRRDIRSQLGWN